MFKQTSYYNKLLETEYDIIGIFLLGSRCLQLSDDNSDYDLVVLTLNGPYKDVSKTEYIMYKDTKIHWYFQSLDTLLVPQDRLSLLCAIQFQNITKEYIVFENENYRALLTYLYKHKYEISKIGSYYLFKNEKSYINDLLTQGITPENGMKYIYHLCVASCYLREEPLDKIFLTPLKHILVSFPEEAILQQALAKIKSGQQYVKANSQSFMCAKEKLYKELPYYNESIY
jgi:hypothetical protein